MPRDYFSFNSKLVEAVEKYPYLYNYHLKEYTNREMVQAAWEQIAQKVDCTAKECKETWKNLRIVFIRNLKKPSTASGAKKKPYYLLDSMSFLKQFIKTDKVVPRIHPSSSQKIEQNAPNRTDLSAIFTESNGDDEDTEEDRDGELFSHSATDETGHLTNVRNIVEHEIESPVQQISTRPPLRRKQTFQRNSVNSNVLNYKESKRSTLDRDSPRQQFLLSLIPDVEEMNSIQFRTFRLEVCGLINRLFLEGSNCPWPMQSHTIGNDRCSKANDDDSIEAATGWLQKDFKNENE